MTTGDTSTSFPEASRAAWRSRVEGELRGTPFDALRTKLLGGVAVAPLYDAADLPPDSGDAPPGVAPYRRGGRAATPELGLPWTATVVADDADLVRLHQALMEDLVGGASGVTLRFDRAARLGRDPETATDDVAVGGAPLHAVGDLDLALAEVQPALVHWFLDAGANGAVAAGLFDRWLVERGVDPAAVPVDVGLDLLGALARDGALPRSLDAHRREAAELVGRADAALPRRRVLRVSDRPYVDAGASRVTALGFALATGVDHLRGLAALGVEASTVARQTAFEVAVDRDVLTELAGLRALRVAWAKVLAAFGVSAGVMTPAHVSGTVAARGLTRRDPWVNMLRGTTATFAAIVGGADAITTVPFDARLGVPDALGRRVARNTQNILGEESHLGRVLDPAGGSYAIEALTEQLARRGWAVLQEVEAAGGMAEALASGWVADRVAGDAAARADAIREGSLALLGVTKFPNPDETLPDRPPRRRHQDVAAAVRRAADGKARGDELPFVQPPGPGSPARIPAPLSPFVDEDVEGGAS